MSTRTEYRRTPGFGASKISIKAGKVYERKVLAELHRLFPAQEALGFTISEQYPLRGGYVDAALLYHSTPFYLIEIKAQWSLDAYHQLRRYAGGDLAHYARVCICKIYHPHVPVPEPVTCFRLESLLHAKKGHLTVIPWNGGSP